MAEAPCQTLFPKQRNYLPFKVSANFLSFPQISYDILSAHYLPRPSGCLGDGVLLSKLAQHTAVVTAGANCHTNLCVQETMERISVCIRAGTPVLALCKGTVSIPQHLPLCKRSSGISRLELMDECAAGLLQASVTSTHLRVPAVKGIGFWSVAWISRSTSTTLLDSLSKDLHSHGK